MQQPTPPFATPVAKRQRHSPPLALPTAAAVANPFPAAVATAATVPSPPRAYAPPSTPHGGKCAPLPTGSTFTIPPELLKGHSSAEADAADALLAAYCKAQGWPRYRPSQRAATMGGSGASKGRANGGGGAARRTALPPIAPPPPATRPCDASVKGRLSCRGGGGGEIGGGLSDFDKPISPPLPHPPALAAHAPWTPPPEGDGTILSLEAASVMASLAGA